MSIIIGHQRIKVHFRGPVDHWGDHTHVFYLRAIPPTVAQDIKEWLDVVCPVHLFRFDEYGGNLSRRGVMMSYQVTIPLDRHARLFGLRW